MRYFLYTIIVFLICMIQTSLLASIHIIFPYLNILYILLFSYYLTRKPGLSLYLFFVTGIFYDFLTGSQVGVTSANYFISLIVYALLSRIFPNERLGKVISILTASISFSLISYISMNFLYANDMKNILIILPLAFINGFLVIMLTNIIQVIKPYKEEKKIRID